MSKNQRRPTSQTHVFDHTLDDTHRTQGIRHHDPHKLFRRNLADRLLRVIGHASIHKKKIKASIFKTRA